MCILRRPCVVNNLQFFKYKNINLVYPPPRPTILEHIMFDGDLIANSKITTNCIFH